MRYFLPLVIFCFFALAACGGYDYCDEYWYEDSYGYWTHTEHCYDYPYYYKFFGPYERSLGYESPSELEDW